MLSLAAPIMVEVDSGGTRPPDKNLLTWSVASYEPDKTFFSFAPLEALNDGRTDTMTVTASGGTFAQLWVTVNFAQPVYLNEIFVMGGQTYSGGNSLPSQINSPQVLTVYQGNSAATPILNSAGARNLGTVTNQNDPPIETTIDTLTLNEFDTPSSVYLFQFVKLDFIDTTYVALINLVLRGAI